MRNIYRSLLLILVGATQKELARQVRYLTVENQLLRSRLPRPARYVDRALPAARFAAWLGPVCQRSRMRLCNLKQAEPAVQG